MNSDAAGGSARDPRIVGLCQVHNEDVFLDRVLANIADFCDRIIVADHRSTDGTAAIARQWAARCPKVSHQAIGHPCEAHELTRPYCGTPTWIFPVDGDEIYDPRGLAALKRRLMRGEFDSYRQLYGHSLHCVRIDATRRSAEGYLTPPSRTVTKLYNYAALVDWAGPCTEKCLGGTLRFQPGFSERSNLNLLETLGWDESPFRLLHACFMRRSSLDPEAPVARLQVGETYEGPLRTRLLNLLRRALRVPAASAYKTQRYCRGPLVERDVAAFFPV